MNWRGLSGAAQTNQGNSDAQDWDTFTHTSHSADPTPGSRIASHPTHLVIGATSRSIPEVNAAGTIHRASARSGHVVLYGTNPSILQTFQFNGNSCAHWFLGEEILL